MLDFLLRLVVDFWATVGEMSPYLLFGFFVAGLLSVFVSQKMVERHLGGRGFLPVLKATLFGIPLPLCSCGVIPVAMSLRKHGASKGSTISFLLSTPQTGVDSILVTYSLLGPVFAIFRPLAALVTGLVGGILVDLFGQEPGDLKMADGGQRTEDSAAPNPQSAIMSPAALTGGRNPQSEAAGEHCCCHHAVSPGRKLLNGLKYGFISLPRDIGKPLLLGLAIAALIATVVPDDFFAARLGRGLPAMLVMMLIGIPMYVCASASVPVAAALILKGLGPGAALVFLITGPGTNAAGLATIWNTLGRRTAILYLLTVAGCALASGLVLDSIIQSIDIGVASHMHHMGPSVVQHLSAVVLLAVLGYAFLTGRRRP
ncbi:MAG: SO_0444 family Cu/Zn efflux transporter [Planctomycetes bacterium]|nr:SO_0444 family Cu/Zn efflux transporter [Planctomycetota bacterium]